MLGKRIRKTLLPLALALVVLLSSVPLFSVSAASYGTVDRVVYVSVNGSDSGKGTKASPYASVSKALSVLCGSAASKNGGTIVLMDNPTPDEGSYALTRGIMSRYSYNNLLTFTGKDPYDGTIYPARLDYENFGLSGPTKFEYLPFYPSRTSLFINTCGYPLIIGEEVYATRFSLLFHDGIGEIKKGTVNSTDTTIDGGTVDSIHVGGGYATDTSYGVLGDCSLRINGGTVSAVKIGFDSYNAAHTDAQIRGNVTVVLEADGNIGTVKTGRIVNNTIGGAFTFVVNGNKTIAVESLPNAQKGVYCVYSKTHGNVEPTDTIGDFTITADRGYVAVIDGEVYENGVHTLPTGETTVRYVRDGSENVSDEAYVVGSSDGMFYPDSPITRAEGIMMLYNTLEHEKDFTETAFSDIAETDWYYDAVCFFEAYDMLPPEWSGSFEPTRALSRAELVYIAERMYVHGTSSYKLADFSDVGEKHPYYDEIMSAYKEGKINGYGDGTFRPEAEITRAETVAVINGLPMFPYRTGQTDRLPRQAKAKAAVTGKRIPSTPHMFCRRRAKPMRR